MSTVVRNTIRVLRDVVHRWPKENGDNLVNFPMDSGCFDISGCACLGDGYVISEESGWLQMKETRDLSC
jgi:hypothetical protein